MQMIEVTRDLSDLDLGQQSPVFEPFLNLGVSLLSPVEVPGTKEIWSIMNQCQALTRQPGMSISVDFVNVQVP